eukprot:5162860-Prorocentrum_lima.AAC.1
MVHGTLGAGIVPSTIQGVEPGVGGRPLRPPLQLPNPPHVPGEERGQLDVASEGFDAIVGRL